MLVAMSAWAATFGLILVFFVILPGIAMGCIAFAIAQVFGERADNQDYARRHRLPGS